MGEGSLRIRTTLDELQSSLWFRPALWIMGLGLLAFACIALDRRLIETDLLERLPWLFTGGEDAARTMLGAIGAAMLTVTTLAFSIIMVTVVQTANAYSPRLLRQYLADSLHQDVLGIFMGTFLFSLLVLRVIYRREEVAFVPSISVTVAILLSMIAIAAFVYFINHVAHSIEVSYIVNLMRVESEEILTDLFPETMGLPHRGETPPPLPSGRPAIIPAAGSGYIQFIEPNELLTTAERADVVLQLERATGDYVLPGVPLAKVWPPEAVSQELVQAVQRAFHLGKERTLVQDLHFGVRQLYDIALRAISPAINDPNTAVNCIDVLGNLLVKMLQHGPVSPYRCAADGTLRVIAVGVTFESMLDLAFNQIRHYAARDYGCTLRLLEMCGEIGYSAIRPAERAALWRHVGMLARAADRNFQEPVDRAALNERILIAATTLAQDPQPLLLNVEKSQLTV